MESHVTAKAECPECFYQVDRAAGLQDPSLRPDPGDVTLCFNCGAILVFEEADQVRQPTEEERIEAERHKVLMRYRRILLQDIAARKREGKLPKSR
jgi:hypothetical protein